ncbi:MAG: hypothetical protein SH821_07920 [Phototrophicales bacterium]|nr:hypothetical protein [Phototrophicales bacterium]
MTDDLLPPWLNDDSDDSDDNDLPDWLQNADDDSPQSPKKSGVTGELSWMQDDSPSNDNPSKKGRASTGLTGELSWNQAETPDFLQDMSPDDSATMGYDDNQADDDDDALPDWLSASDDADDDDNSGLPAWLDDDALEESERLVQQSFTMTDEMSVVDFLDEEDDEESEELPSWLTDESPTTSQSNVFAGAVDTSTWGNFEGSDEPTNEESLTDAFTDDSWISDTETPDLEEDFSDLFTQSSPTSDFNRSDLPTTGMLFGDDDFSNEVDEGSFDLLGTPNDIDSLLGGDDFDLLGELNDDGDDAQAFDLFGELAEPQTPIANELANDDDFMSNFGDDDLFDEDIDIDALLGEEDPFRQFDTNTVSEEAEDDLSWLEDISNVPFQDTRPEPLFKPETRAKLSQNLPQSQPEPELDIENYLASLDDMSLSSITGDVDFESADLDFETLFDDNREEMGMSGLSPDAPSWLTDLTAVTAGENSAAAILSGQKDRPAEDLPDRLKALRERGFDVQSHPKTDAEVLSALMPVSGVMLSDTADSAIATVALTAGQVQRAELLRTIVGNALEANEADEKTRRPRRLPIERLFITAILLVAVLAPFFLDNLRIGAPPPNQFVVGSRQDAFYRLMDTIPAGVHILIAAEYGAMSAGELDIATESVVRHVLANGGIPVIISSNAVGLVRVDNLMDTIAAQNRLVANVDYVVVRYLVTDVVGLRDFSENLSSYLAFDVDGNRTRLAIDDLNDFARVVIITESADNLRLWGEQVLPLMTQPFLAITSYSAAPLSEPYLSIRAGAYLSGYGDSYTYQTMVNRLLTGGEVIIPTLPPTVEIIIPTTEVPVVIPIDADSTAEITEISPIVTESVVDTTPDAITATPDSAIVTTEAPTATLTAMPSATPTATFTPTPSPTPIVARFAIITAATPINIRPDPSTTNPPAGVLRPEERALIINQVTGVDGQQWYNITFVNNAGETVIGWVREDLIQIEETVLTPTPTPSMTPSSKQMRMIMRVGIPQKGQESTPEITPEATPSAEATLEAEITPQVTVTAVVVPTLPAVTSIVVDIPMPDTDRLIAPMDVTDRQARWDSMALGILVAVIVIGVGNLFNLVRVIFRKRRR